MKKSKGYMGGGKMKTKGSKMKKAWQAGKLKMVTNKEGKEVPFFAADGKGKMMAGGKVPKTKGYFKGGKTKGMAKGGKTKGYMRGGKLKVVWLAAWQEALERLDLNLSGKTAKWLLIAPWVRPVL